MPSGNAARDAGKVTNVHQLTNPYRFHDSPRPSGDEALAALTLLAELGFGFFGTIAARSVRGAQAAAAAVVVVVEELTGSTVTGWDPDESSRSINGTSSCYPVHQVDRPAVVLPEPRQTRGEGAARDGRCVHSVCHGLLLSYPHRAGSGRRTDPGPQTIRAVAFPTEFPLGAEDQHLGQMASRRTRQVKVVLAWPPPTAVTVTL
ncbi:hypothetical protein AB0K05_38995 [Nonomuraea sp. NPDC049486]|uniref:hypothetical protein n=1 Tax=Nonomuraea sp. NPDC049486 TaxID=3155773 RepID=UPI003445785E